MYEFLFMQRHELSDSNESYMRICTLYAYLTETSTQGKYLWFSSFNYMWSEKKGYLSQLKSTDRDECYTCLVYRRNVRHT
jgi:hypothetical protein